jgi:glycosyltransferase involved in cell wall biosynthesis
MRDVGAYSVSELLACRPLVDQFKYVRNQAVERFYRSTGAEARDKFFAKRPHGVGRTVAVTIAFNTPWVIELFLRAAKLNLPDTAIIVADNSTDAAARVEISRLCDVHGADYVGLPRNPERHPNRSHGIAMNWVYYNLVKPLGPDVFAFLDHDLFALSPFDLATAVAQQPVYGRYKLNPKERAWSLWAGYAVFDNAAIKERKLDFGYDRPFNLDTGGNNWLRLYRFLDDRAMRFARIRTTWFRDPADMSIHGGIMFDSFLHVVGASYGAKGRDARRVAFFQHLIGEIEAGRQWEDFVTDWQEGDPRDPKKFLG